MQRNPRTQMTLKSWSRESRLYSSEQGAERPSRRRPAEACTGHPACHGGRLLGQPMGVPRLVGLVGVAGADRLSHLLIAAMCAGLRRPHPYCKAVLTVRAMMTPAAPAHRRVSTTPRRSSRSKVKAPARTAYCQGWLSARVSGMAEP